MQRSRQPHSCENEFSGRSRHLPDAYASFIEAVRSIVAMATMATMAYGTVLSEYGEVQQVKTQLVNLLKCPRGV